MIQKILTDALTGIDNKTFDGGRILSLLSFVMYYGLALGGLAQGHPWSAMDFAGGLSTMAISFGLHLKLKRSTEPKAGENEQ